MDQKSGPINGLSEIDQKIYDVLSTRERMNNVWIFSIYKHEKMFSN